MSDDTPAPGPDEGERDPNADASVLDLQAKVIEQNAGMIQQLNLINQGPSRQLLAEIQHEVLIDIIFDQEQKDAYDTACHIRLNQELKRALEQFASGLIVPGGGNDGA